MTPRSMDVLLYLAEHADRIVSSEELLDTFWTPLASDHAIHKAIAELRSALGDSVRAQRFIKTVPKRGYRLLVVPTEVLEQQKQSPGPATVTGNRVSALLLRLQYIDYKWLAAGLLVGISLWAVSAVAPSLEQRPGERRSLVIAQYPFQVRTRDAEGAELFAQGLYSNLVTRLSDIERLHVIPVESLDSEAESGTIGNYAANLAEFQVRGTIVQTEKNTRLYLNLMRSSNGVVEVSRRLEIIPSAEPEQLDPLTDRLVNLIVNHLTSELQSIPGTARSRTRQAL